MGSHNHIHLQEEMDSPPPLFGTKMFPNQYISTFECMIALDIHIYK